MGTGENLLKGTHGVFQRHEFTFITSENLGDLERLRHETLDFTSTLDLSNKQINFYKYRTRKRDKSYGQFVLF